MDTTTGFFLAVILTSRQIKSDAEGDPPGESTRKTMALTEESSRSCRNAEEIVLDPRRSSPNDGRIEFFSLSLTTRQLS